MKQGVRWYRSPPHRAKEWAAYRPAVFFSRRRKYPKLFYIYKKIKSIRIVMEERRRRKKNGLCMLRPHEMFLKLKKRGERCWLLSMEVDSALRLLEKWERRERKRVSRFARSPVAEEERQIGERQRQQNTHGTYCSVKCYSEQSSSSIHSPPYPLCPCKVLVDPIQFGWRKENKRRERERLERERARVIIPFSSGSCHAECRFTSSSS